MNIVILHGAHGGPDTNWFPWLRDRLLRSDHSVAIPRFPTPVGQSLAAWSGVLDSTVSSPPGTTVLIGHSLGVAFALRRAESSIERFAGAFLVAGFFGVLGLPDYDPINASFFQDDLDWSAVRKNIGYAHCFAGDDDPYVPLHRSQRISDRLNCELTVIPNGGHLNSECGFDQFDELAQCLERFLRTFKS